MDASTKLEIGDVVQLSPLTCGNPMLAACFMIVTDPKAFGAQGYVQTTGENGTMGSQAYYRARWEEMELIGHAAWTLDREAD